MKTIENVDSVVPYVSGRAQAVFQNKNWSTSVLGTSIDYEKVKKAAGEMVGTLSFLLAAIAGVSLLVGGIGIMNIMLVMVMERTHEIGLRKSLGAEKSDILIQFLVESVLICLVGGIIGVVFGASVSWGISQFAGWNTLISIGSIVLGFGFSVFVGLIFGLWPAWRASNLLPIEALRFE